MCTCMHWYWTTKVIHVPCYKSKQYRNLWSEHLPSCPAVPAPGGSHHELTNESPSWLLLSHPRAGSWVLLVVLLQERNHPVQTVKDGTHLSVAAPMIAPSFSSSVIIHCVNESWLRNRMLMGIWVISSVFTLLNNSAGTCTHTLVHL